jgi:hypothetical protein
MAENIAINAILVYLIIIFVLLTIKPKLMFCNGKIRSFGFGENKSIITLQMVSIFGAIMAYFLFMINEV